MSAISEDLAKIQSAIYGEEVRGAIHDAISQCYSDVSNPTLQTEAIEAAIQVKIDEGEMAALTIADGTITGAKLVDGTIPTAKIADGAITMAKLSSDIDLDVDTDTTLTQSGIPADAKAVGDALAEAMTGESLEDGESMKYVLSSKYDDFKIVDGYGYFDAKKLLNNTFDWSGAPMPGIADSAPNYVFRYEHAKKFLLGPDIIEGLFSPDFPMKEHDFNGGAGYLPEGYWITINPDRPTGSKFVTIPKSAFGNSGTIGNFAFNYLDGSIGLKMNEAQIVEYDPTEILSGVTTGGLFSTTTIEGVIFYKGFLTWNWSDLFDFKNTTENMYRLFNSLGFNEAYNDYAKEYVNSGTTRLNYQVKADAVSGANNAVNVALYLISRGLKFYYVAPEEETT